MGDPRMAVRTALPPDPPRRWRRPAGDIQGPGRGRGRWVLPPGPVWEAGRGSRRPAAALGVLLAGPLLAIRAFVRPHLITALLLGLVLFALCRESPSGRPAWAWFCPPSFCSGPTCTPASSSGCCSSCSTGPAKPSPAVSAARARPTPPMARTVAGLRGLGDASASSIRTTWTPCSTRYGW